MLPKKVRDVQRLTLGARRIVVGSGTSVNGLPHIIAAESPPGLCSMAFAAFTACRIDPVSVMSSSPRTSAGTVTFAVTGRTSPATMRRSSRAARSPVRKKSTCGYV